MSKACAFANLMRCALTASTTIKEMRKKPSKYSHFVSALIRNSCAIQEVVEVRDLNVGGKPGDKSSGEATVPGGPCGSVKPVQFDALVATLAAK